MLGPTGRRKQVHIGLLGHIDSGKTKVAECLTEIISTAGLDKHPQAKERGITIDLGFSFFSLSEDKYMVTIVDAPGHANLIRSVVACANIIDLALVVVDAEKGPQVQTGEHLMILHSMGIKDIIFVVNKIDLVQDLAIKKTIESLKSLISGLDFTVHDFIPVSAKERKGIEQLKDSMTRFFDTHPEKIKRNLDGPFLFLFDHYFLIKGKGTILTGNTLRGNAKIGDSITILPENIETKIKSLQRHKEATETTQAGDRVGIAVSNVDPEQVSRGSFAVSNPKDYKPTNMVEGQVRVNGYFKYDIPFGSEITINSGMQVFQAKIYPYSPEENKRFPKDIKITGKELVCQCILLFKEEEYIIPGSPMLVSRLDLPHTKLRIIGSFYKRDKDAEVSNQPIFYTKKQRTGVVRSLRLEDKIAIVEGFANTAKRAEYFIGQKAELPFGKILETFGTKGNLKVQIIEMPENPQDLIGKNVEIHYLKEKRVSF